MKTAFSSPSCNVLRRPLPGVTLLLLALVAQLFLAGREGCGSEDQQETWKSPVQALGTVYEHPDGTVEAELILISTLKSQHRFIDAATDVELVVDGVTVALPKDASQQGRWAVTSTQAAQLQLDKDTRYLFRFQLDDPELAGDEAGGRFVGEVRASALERVISPLDTEYYRDHSLEIEITPALGNKIKGVLRVYGPDGEVTWNNFDTSHPQFDGSKHATLIAGGKHTIPGSAFQQAGDHRIVLYTMDYSAGFDPALSAELGVLSGFMAGSAAEISVTIQ